MRRLVWLTLAIAIAPSRAHADLLARALLAVGEDGDGTTVAPTGAAALEDLASWAGPTRTTTLGALLQVTVRQAPALANARFDIAVAEAQISETWARRDWTIKAQAVGTRSYGGVSSGIPIDSRYGGIV